MAGVLTEEEVTVVMEIIEEEEEESSSSSDLTSEASDSEAEMLQLFIGMVQPELNKRNTIQNFCEEVVPAYSEREFITHFRIQKRLMQSLVEKFTASEVYQALILPKSSHVTISPEKHMLTFLWFAGHQTASFRDVADRFDLSISSLHDVTTRVIKFLSSLAFSIIRWPTPEEKARTMAHYLEAKGIDHIIGSVDGSHIRLDKPTQNGNDYINRHNYPSMILQGVCNETRKFIDVFIGYPGSVHDARVFQNSTFYESLQQLCEGGFLLGDSAYPTLDVLMTPYRDNGHLTAAQRHYNVKLSSCRISIEHAFGMLKQRFRQLYHLKLKGHERICHFIRACCVLHNISDLEELELFAGEENPEDNQPHQDLQDAGGHALGNERRDELARHLYGLRIQN